MVKHVHTLKYVPKKLNHAGVFGGAMFLAVCNTCEQSFIYEKPPIEKENL
jgi:hypothetical protein